MRILIIDDDEDLRNLLAHYIRGRWADAVVDGYDPLSHDMPDAAFALGSYDVLILDYMLGRGDGLEWLQALKRRADCPKVLFLTGAGNEIIAVRAMKAGADDYQRKQEMTREKLINSIRDLTAGTMERTVSPDLASRMEGHELREKIQIPGIRVLHLIGEGGTSRVYLASRERDDEPLVVKVLRQEITKDKKALARFMEEYSMVERIQSRHVARIHSHGQSQANAYLVMEFFEGGDLNKRLGNKPVAAEEALRLLRELMFALGDIHEKGILHRDLKPQNLMFRNDLRTDIYSAGVLLYQMLTGKHLFDGETAVEVALHHLNTPPPPLPDKLSQYQRLIDKLVEKDRDARFRNADEVIGFLSRKFYQEGTPKLDITQKLH